MSFLLSFVSLHVFLTLSRKSCLVAASGGAVVEGPSPAPENRYDYVVSLKHPRFNTHICSGTLIAPSWILTLASCVDSVELPFAHINGYFRDGPFVEDIATTAIVVHETFRGSSTLDPFDVALCQLATPSTQTPIALADIPIETGEAVDVVGWGRIESQGAFSDVLQLDANRPVAACAGDWPNIDSAFACLTTRQCSGDAGSPIIASGDAATADVQVGIATQVMGDCSFAERPAPFLDVGPLYTWISENT